MNLRRRRWGIAAKAIMTPELWQRLVDANKPWSSCMLVPDLSPANNSRNSFSTRWCAGFFLAIQIIAPPVKLFIIADRNRQMCSWL
jgi:hypothetical protein